MCHKADDREIRLEIQTFVRACCRSWGRLVLHDWNCQRRVIRYFATHLEYLYECSWACREVAIQIKRTFYRTSVRCLTPKETENERDHGFGAALPSLRWPA